MPQPLTQEEAKEMAKVGQAIWFILASAGRYAKQGLVAFTEVAQCSVEVRYHLYEILTADSPGEEE